MTREKIFFWLITLLWKKIKINNYRYAKETTRTPKRTFHIVANLNSGKTTRARQLTESLKTGKRAATGAGLTNPQPNGKWCPATSRWRSPRIDQIYVQAAQHQCITRSARTSSPPYGKLYPITSHLCSEGHHNPPPHPPHLPPTHHLDGGELA